MSAIQFKSQYYQKYPFHKYVSYKTKFPAQTIYSTKNLLRKMVLDI